MTGKGKSLSANRYPTKSKTAKGTKRLPSYKDMIRAAIISQKQPRGSSRQSILNYICSNYTISDKNKANRYLKQALKTGVKTGFLNDATGKRTTEYFKLAEDTNKELRRSSKQTEAIKKSNLLTSGSKPVNVCQKGVRTNSTKTRRAKSRKRTVKKKRSSQSTCKTKSKASQKARNDTPGKSRKDKDTCKKGTEGRQSSSHVHGTKSANQNTRKSGKKPPKSSTDLLTSERSDSETPSQAHEIHTNSHEDTTHQSTVTYSSHIEATLLETNVLPLLIAPIKAVAIAGDGKKLTLEVNTNNVRLYSADKRNHLSCLSLKDKPFDIAVFSDNQAVVTTGHLIYFIDFSSDFLSVMYTFFSTDYVVYGITACQENIYVTCRDGDLSVKMIDSSGNIYWSVAIDRNGNESEQSLSGITSFDADGHVRLVVTDDYENTIKLLDGESGELLATHHARSLGVSSPVTDIYNNVYVSYLASGFVYALTSDLSAERGLVISKPYQFMTFPLDKKRALQHYFRRMAYDRNSNQLVIAVGIGQMQVFQLKQK